MAESAEEQRIERDQDFYEELMRLPEMKGWSGRNHSPYELVELDDTSEENKVKDLFSLKDYSHKPYLIKRIENPFLYGQFLLKMHKVQRNHRENNMFHCTKTSNLESICSKNFNWRLKGRSRGVKFGQGVSFSPDAYYASHFGNVMITAKVLMGPSTLGNLFTEIPKEPYTSTDNGKNTVYVKYEDDDFYPNYVIYYR